MPGKIIVRRRGCRGPFKRRRLPGIVADLLAFEQAPNEIEVENELDRHGNDRRDRYEQNQRMRVIQKAILTEVRVTSRHSQKTHRVERNKDRIDAEESNPKMKLAQAFVHHASKHFRKPEVSRREHAKDRSHTHYQVEMRRYEVSVVKEKVQRRLTENESGNSTRHEQRDESDREKHRRCKTNLRAPKRPDPVERLDGRRDTD